MDPRPADPQQLWHSVRNPSKSRPQRGISYDCINTHVATRPFRHLLLEWYQSARRELPWRETRDPWRILLSEVMLQQTRVAAVVPFYERFIERYPDPLALAQAPEAEYLALWSGLGYYARARNLWRAARAIAFLGRFPQTFEGIRLLPASALYRRGCRQHRLRLAARRCSTAMSCACSAG